MSAVTTAVGFDINIGGFSQGHQPSCFANPKGDGHVFKGVGRGDFDRFGAPYDKAYIKRCGLPETLVGSKKHISDAVGDALEETIGKLHADGAPFYLQFYTYAVHGPVKARPDLKQKFAGKKNAEYLGFIAGVDENLKRLLDLLDDPNGDGDHADSIAENTVVFFTSDNGGTHADNQPLKGKKGMLGEGGIRVPLIARWPGTIPPGTVTDRMIHCLDFYPTCLQLAGDRWQPDPATHPLDGDPFLHVLKNPASKDTRDGIYYLFPGYMDVRAQPTVVGIEDTPEGRFKLFYYYEANAWELYNISKDQGETTNLIKQQPRIAAHIAQRLQTWLGQQHPTWQPKYPIDKKTGKPAGPPPDL